MRGNYRRVQMISVNKRTGGRFRRSADGLIGVIVDPTTAGLGDSERATGYAEPWDDALNN